MSTWSIIRDTEDPALNIVLYRGLLKRPSALGLARRVTMRKSAYSERNAVRAVVSHLDLGLAILGQGPIFSNMVALREIQEIGNRVSKFCFDWYSRQFGFHVPYLGAPETVNDDVFHPQILGAAGGGFDLHWCARNAPSELHGTVLQNIHVPYAVR
jgi:hypothetical protein